MYDIWETVTSWVRDVAQWTGVAFGVVLISKSGPFVATTVGIILLMRCLDWRYGNDDHV
jgi:hypothetical protein